ncbi:MAG: hypothetical protein ACKOX6_03025 [Bdellovibrio sp.]
MKLFFSAIVSAIMFGSVPVFAGPGLYLKKPITFPQGEDSVTVARHGVSEEGSSRCWIVGYRDADGLPGRTLPAGTVVPVHKKESRRLSSDGGGGWYRTSGVYAWNDDSSDTYRIYVQCTDLYHVIQSFPTAAEAVRLFPEYIQEVKLD